MIEDSLTGLSTGVSIQATITFQRNRTFHTWCFLNTVKCDGLCLIKTLKMVVKAVCVLNGDAKGTVFFEQQVNDNKYKIFKFMKLNTKVKLPAAPHRAEHVRTHTYICMHTCTYMHM